MLTIISVLLVVVGCLNWLCIGLLQFDFVAGLFGSQSNVFSRIIYVIIGVAAIVFSYLLIKNKGKLTFSFKKMKNKMMPAQATAESAQDNAKKSNNYTTESANDNSKDYEYDNASRQTESATDNSKRRDKDYEKMINVESATDDE